MRSDREHEDEKARSRSLNSPRGFDGLASLVSVLPEPSANSMPPSVSVGAPPPSASEHSRPATEANPTDHPSRNSLSLLGTAAIALGLAFVGVSIFLANQPSRSPSVVSSNANSGFRQQTSEPQVYSPPDLQDPQSTATASPPDAPLHEVAPSQGINLVLNASEINYCLSERVRLDAMRPLINEKSKVQLHKFNLRSNDFNLRCAKVQYRGSDLDRVKKLVDARRSQLRLEAVSTVSHWH